MKAFKNIRLPFVLKHAVLALGSQQKNSVCFARGDTAGMSRVRLDLGDLNDCLEFEKEVFFLLKKKPDIVAYDLHPEYQATKYALKLRSSGYKLKGVQHHHAHIAGCMAENRLPNEEVIGVCLDGSGIGADGTIWGAEFFSPCGYGGFTRAGHLEPVPLIGGEKAIREPWRLLAWWLNKLYGKKMLNTGIPFIKKFDKKKWEILRKMQERGFNSIPASSMGRLFDACASLILQKPNSLREADLAIELEQCAGSSGLKEKPYEFRIIKIKGVPEDTRMISPLPVFAGLISDIKKGMSRNKMAYKFHLTVAQMVRRMCAILREEHGLNKVVLSGGVFQNRLLSSLCGQLLSDEKFEVFFSKDISSNDSGIALGQAVIAGQ